MPPTAGAFDADLGASSPEHRHGHAYRSLPRHRHAGPWTSSALLCAYAAAALVARAIFVSVATPERPSGTRSEDASAEDAALTASALLVWKPAGTSPSRLVTKLDDERSQARRTFAHPELPVMPVIRVSKSGICR